MEIDLIYKFYLYYSFCPLCLRVLTKRHTEFVYDKGILRKNAFLLLIPIGFYQDNDLGSSR